LELLKIGQRIVVVLISFMFIRCGEDNHLTAATKSLDSMQVVLTTKSSELLAIDTIVLNKALDKFTQYAAFINQHVNDTLTKAEADYLQKFFVSGNTLLSVKNNRNTLLMRSGIIHSQIDNLKKDYSNRVISRVEFIVNASSEKKASAEVINIFQETSTAFYKNIQDFKNSILPVEELIKRRNNGNLPVLVKDNEPF